MDMRAPLKMYDVVVIKQSGDKAIVTGIEAIYDTPIRGNDWLTGFVPTRPQRLLGYTYELLSAMNENFRYEGFPASELIYPQFTLNDILFINQAKATAQVAYVGPPEQPLAYKLKLLTLPNGQPIDANKIPLYLYYHLESDQLSICQVDILPDEKETEDE